MVFIIKATHALGPAPQTSRCQIQIPDVQLPTGSSYWLAYGNYYAAIKPGGEQSKLWWPNLPGGVPQTKTTLRIDVARQFRTNLDVSRCAAEKMNCHLPGIVTAWTVASLMEIGWEELYLEPWQVRAFSASIDGIESYHDSAFYLGNLGARHEKESVHWTIADLEETCDEAFAVAHDFQEKIGAVGFVNRNMGSLRDKTLKVMGIVRPMFAFQIMQTVLKLSPDNRPKEILFEDPLLATDGYQGFLRVFSKEPAHYRVI